MGPWAGGRWDNHDWYCCWFWQSGEIIGQSSLPMTPAWPEKMRWQRDWVILKEALVWMESELSVEFYLTENGTFAFGHLFKSENKLIFNTPLTLYNEHCAFFCVYQSKWHLSVRVIIVNSIENSDYTAARLISFY